MNKTRNRVCIVLLVLIFFQFKSISQTPQEADAFYNKAVEFYEKGDYINAAKMYEKAAEIEKQLTPLNSEDLAYELQNSGMCYMLGENNIKAIEKLNEAYLIFEDIEFISEQAQVLFTIIEIYQKLNIREKAEEIAYLKKAIILFEKAGDYAHSVLTFNKIAAIYKDLNQFDLALINTRRAVLACEKIENSHLIAYTKNNHGEILSFFNELDSAKVFFESAYEIYKNLNLKNDLGVVCNNLGIVNSELGNFEKAVENNNEAIICFNEINDKSGVANTYNNTAKIYEHWGKMESALEFYTKAYDLFEKNKDYEGIAIVFNNLGSLYFLFSYYDEAMDNFLQSENIYSQLNDKIGVAAVKSNIGRLLHNTGEYDLSINKYFESLKIYEKEEDIGGIAISYNNIGSVYQEWSVFDSAYYYFNESLIIQKKLGREIEVAKSLNNIAGLYIEWGKMDEALNYYNQSYAIFKNKGDLRNKAAVIQNMAALYFSKGLYGKSLENYNQAVEIYKTIKDLSNYANSLNNMGSVFHITGKIDDAINTYSIALDLNEKLSQKSNLARTYYNLGVSFIEKKEYLKSIDNLSKAVEIIEKIRKTAKGEMRIEYLQGVIQVYESLIIANVLNGNFADAFYYIELSSSKYFAEIIGKESPQNIELESVSKSLGINKSAIIYSTLDNPTLTIMNLSPEGNSEIKLVNKKRVISEFIDDIEIRSKIIQSLTEKEIFELKKYIDSKSEYKLRIDFEKKLFDLFVITYIEMLSVPSLGNDERVKKMSYGLFTLLIEPIEKNLANSKKLIIVPNGVLGRLPFETLIDKDGRYLVEKYDISYINSLTIRSLLQERSYSSFSKDILAIGLSDFKHSYSEKSNNEVNKNKTSSQRSRAYRLSEEGLSLGEVYENLALKNLNNLPGSYNEILSIKDIFPKSDTLTNSRATESRIKFLSSQGDLKKYEIIHISTHGMSIKEIPLLSCLVLFQAKQEINGEDGFLRVKEIAQLNLESELVNLSACETGVGKHFSGEGVVGLTQSFLIAGANRIIVSQWEVDDEASEKFMEEFYKIVRDEDISFSEALSKVKRKFISGEINIFWKDPVFWAPFTLYGLE